MAHQLEGRRFSSQDSILALPMRLGWWWLALAILVALPCTGQQRSQTLEAARQKRLERNRFEKQADAGDYTLAAAFTGRSMIAPGRSVLVRDHLVVEVLLIPKRRNEQRIDLIAFGLKVNDESYFRLPQAASVAAYAVRNPDLREGGRLQAGAQVGGGTVIWDSEGRPTRPRFPGDSRVPPRRPTEDREAQRQADPAELDAEAVIANAFPEGLVLEPTVGYLYFPAEIDLQKIRKLELLFRPAGKDSPEIVLRLK